MKDEARNPRVQSDLALAPSDLAGASGVVRQVGRRPGGAGLAGNWFGAVKPDARVFFFGPGPCLPVQPPESQPHPTPSLAGRPSHHFVSLPHHLSPSLSLNHLQPTRKPTSLAPVQLILLFSSFMHHGISSQRIMLSRPPTPTRPTLRAGNREVTGHFEASSRLPSTPLDPCPAQPKRVVLCHRSHAESLTWEPGCKVTSHCVAVALSRHLVRRAHGDSDGGVWRGSHLVSIRSRSATPPRPPHPTASYKGQQKTPWLVPVGHVVRDGGCLGPLLDLV